MLCCLPRPSLLLGSRPAGSFGLLNTVLIRLATALCLSPAWGRPRVLSSSRGFTPLRQTEVHLLLETVHPGNLDLQAIPELDDTAGASSDDLKTSGVECVEVVLQFGERHQAAHTQASHIDEKTEVPEIRHQRGIALWTA